ncbi:MAG: DMT family transporter [Chitinophagaceae bacterium]|nr:DMT family transporter [Chitinophagaceae bacterium]MCW5904347.1 DMT family transporter [Chitinophagaceae bacterium]
MAVKSLLLLMVCFFAGALMPMQAGVNFKLAKAINNNIIGAALISFIIGTTVLACYVLFTNQLKFNVITVAKTQPYWIWMGGILGAFFVAATTLIVPKIGSSLAFSSIIAGQLFISVIIDHYGLLGVPITPINIKKIAGIILLGIAIWIIKEN